MTPVEHLRHLSAAGDVWSAEALAREILAGDPRNAEAALHLFSALRWQRDPAKYPEALQLGERIRCRSDTEADAEFGLNLAGMLFELGDDAAAVASKFRVVYAPSKLPRWTGEVLPGRSLLVVGHPYPDIAGELVPFGHTSYVVAQRIIWMTADLRWRPVLERSDPRVRVIAKGQPVPEADAADCYIAGADLPALTLNGGRMLRPQRYIHPDPGDVAAWAARLPKGCPRIGLAWRGGRPGLADYRNPPLSAFAVLAGLSATFVCLQYGDTATDVAQLRALGLAVHRVPGWDPLKSLDDAFALTDACDLVVTNDQSAAHIAGALGKPTVLLVAFYTHFTAYGPPGRSVFYPTMRVLTQPRLGDWGSVFAELQQYLHAQLRGPACP